MAGMEQRGMSVAILLQIGHSQTKKETDPDGEVIIIYGENVTFSEVTQ